MITNEPPAQKLGKLRVESGVAASEDLILIAAGARKLRGFQKTGRPGVGPPSLRATPSKPRAFPAYAAGGFSGILGTERPTTNRDCALRYSRYDGGPSDT